MNRQQIQSKIILIGDSCKDIYEYVNIDRISPEAPVPVCVHQYTEEKPGMAANVYENLKALGCLVNFYFPKVQSTKKRIIDIKSQQHIVRLDDDKKADRIDLHQIDLLSAKAVVISDYNKGFLDYEDIEYIICMAYAKGIPVFIDTKKTDLQRFNGSYVKINELEYKTAQTLCDDLIVTRASKGVLHNDTHYDVKPVDVVDVCGAGDTFLAALAAEFVNTNDIDKAIKFAIKASSITVQNMGVYAPTRKEIK